MVKQFLLTLDIGTQSTRAAVIDLEWNIIAITQIQHEVDSPHPGWAQQKPNQWWEELCKATKQVIEKAVINPKAIAAVATCGQMHGAVGIDERGELTTESAQLWCDKRCKDQCVQVSSKHDDEALLNLAGSSINPAWTAVKVRWLKQHAPDVYNRTRWFLVPKDYINFKLTSVPAADPSEASGSFLWDWKTDGYSQELADVLGVDLDRFAPVHASSEVIGQVTKVASKQTGIPEGTPVVAGGGDFPVSMLGFGIVGKGVTADVTGTSTLIAAHSETPIIHPAIQNLRHVVDGWIPFTILDCGGMSMKWCKDLAASIAGREFAYNEMIALANQAPPGCDGLTFYPYMLGERRHDNTAARGGYFGLTLNHEASHFIRAVMESVALSVGRDVHQLEQSGLEIDRIWCVGGGARNALWNQIKADVIQRPIELSEEPEAGLRGAAMLAAYGAGLIKDLTEAAISRRVSSLTINPQPENKKAYQKALRQFTRCYDHMLGFWQDKESD